MSLAWILGSTFTISLVAFVGVLTLFFKERLLRKVLTALVAFAAGALMGGAFLHLIPEAILTLGMHEVSLLNVFLYFLLGFCVFFVVEQLIRWHHHHTLEHPEIMPFSYLILIGDAVHNFIDGIVIAASFIVNFPVGIATALAVALHEVPQEIGDFGVLVYGGFEKVKALMLNYACATLIFFGALIGYVVHGMLGNSIVFLLPFAAGNFVYVAGADLVPEIGFKRSLKKTLMRFSLFLMGLAIMFIIKLT
jgi:zinc and cadmium transporter